MSGGVHGAPANTRDGGTHKRFARHHEFASLNPEMRVGIVQSRIFKVYVH